MIAKRIFLALTLAAIVVVSGAVALAQSEDEGSNEKLLTQSATPMHGRREPCCLVERTPTPITACRSVFGICGRVIDYPAVVFRFGHAP